MITESKHGHESTVQGAVCNNIGVVYEKQTKYPEALEFYNKSLDIRVKVFGPDHPKVARGGAEQNVNYAHFALTRTL